MPKKIFGLRVFTWFMIMIIAFLQYEFWFQPGGFFHMMEVRAELKKQQAANAVLDQQNQALIKQVSLLQANNRLLDEQARSQLNMVGKNEVLYQTP